MDRSTIISTILAVIVIISAAFAVSARYVSKDTFGEFKEGVVHRLDRIDSKLDQLLDK